MKTKNILIIATISVLFVIVLCVVASNYSAKAQILYRWTNLLHNKQAAAAMISSLEEMAQYSGFSLKETSDKAQVFYMAGWPTKDAALTAGSVLRGIKETGIDLTGPYVRSGFYTPEELANLQAMIEQAGK